MPLDLTPLQNAHRLLLQVELRPVQGTRFQPTNFPNLGAAEYVSWDQEKKDYVPTILVESAQSMANHMESVCLDPATHELAKCLKGLPYVKVIDLTGGYVTSSLEESHRLNSHYIEDSDWFENTFGPGLGFGKKGKSWFRTGEAEGRPIDFYNRVYPTILRFDPNCLVHGVFLESIAGQIRFPRVLSSFVEAKDTRRAANGGARLDKVTLSKAGGADSSAGTGNVVFARDEFTAKSIIAYFNLDLAQIRGYRLGAAVERMLVAFALYKIRALLARGLRLRTACDLAPAGDGLAATSPAGYAIPEFAELDEILPGLIQTVAGEGLFADPPVTTITYRKT